MHSIHCPEVLNTILIAFDMLQLQLFIMYLIAQFVEKQRYVRCSSSLYGAAYIIALLILNRLIYTIDMFNRILIYDYKLNITAGPSCHDSIQNIATWIYWYS